MKRVALLGMPNTGKSTVFNRLTGAAAHVGNWPGITVDLQSARIQLGGDTIEVVDLPGIYDLRGFGDDEQVVRDFLEHEPVNLLLIVLNAAQLDRQLALVPQLKLLRVPLLLALNMADEADSLGIRIDTEKLAAALGLPVFLISAKYGHGFAQTLETVVSLLNHSPSTNGAHPAVTGCAKCHDCSLALDSAAVEGLDAIVSASVHLPRNLPEGWTGKIDRVLLHPSFGLPLFFAAIFLGFELVYNIGSRLQNVLSLTLYSVKLELLAPALAGAPVLVRSFLLEGLYDGVGTVISFLPIIVAFLVFMAIVEDTGYLARAAFLMDAFMARLGLDGRSFVIQLMGFGCNVPAIMATRVMRSRGLRLLTMMVIPFSLCSARLQVFLFFTAAVFSRRAAPVVLFSLYLVSFAVVILTALTWRGRYRDREPLMLELPPYRLPTARRLLIQAWQESKHFLVGASGFILAGVIGVWFLTHFPIGVPAASPATLAGRLAAWMGPIFRPLGIEPLLSLTLLFGFVAKEIVIGALAVIYGSGQANLAGALAQHLDWARAYSFMLFTLIYTPCLSALAVLKQESRSWWFTLLTTGWSLGLAWLVSFAFYQGILALR